MHPAVDKKKFAHKLSKKIETQIEKRISLFSIFDEPRPKYIAKITPIDRFLDATLLPFIPQSVRPNYVTIFRFVSIPFILFFLFQSAYAVAFVLFTIAAISDAVDGALARTRGKITPWGIVFDPFADKLLIGSVGGLLIFKFLNPALALVIIGIELVLIISAYYRFKGKIVPAKTVGKVKMILECVGVGFIFLFILTGMPAMLTISTYVLYVAVFFAVLSVLIYRSI